MGNSRAKRAAPAPRGASKRTARDSESKAKTQPEIVLIDPADPFFVAIEKAIAKDPDILHRWVDLALKEMPPQSETTPGMAGKRTPAAPPKGRVAKHTESAER